MDTKDCKRCQKTLDTNNFSINKSRYDGYQSHCIKCMKEYRKEHYRNNKQQYYNRNIVQKERLGIWIQEYKKYRSCKDCKKSYPYEPWLMEFDHLDSDLKEMAVSLIARYGSLKKVIKEIEKCDLLCVLCHRKRTASRGHYKLREITQDYRGWLQGSDGSPTPVLEGSIPSHPAT